MWNLINPLEIRQFFDGHPDRVFALILILCATLVLIVAAVTRKRPVHNHFDNYETRVLSSGLAPGCYIVDEHRRLFIVPNPLEYFAPQKPPPDQRYIDEYFDFIHGQNNEAAPGHTNNVPFRTSKRRPKMTGSKRMRILRRDGFRCQMCGRKANEEDGLTLHIDHKMPLAKGGSNSDENLWVLCSECNEAKSDTVIEELFGSDEQEDGV